MHPTKYFLIFPLLVCIFSGCKKDTLTNDNSVLIGTWTSISSMAQPGNCGIIAGYLSNPNFKLTLLEKGKFKLITSDNKTETGRLILKNGLVTFDYKRKTGTLNGSTILKFNADTLNIDRNMCNDDYLFRFVKN